jgi:hypothetical protein
MYEEIQGVVEETKPILFISHLGGFITSISDVIQQ